VLRTCWANPINKRTGSWYGGSKVDSSEEEEGEEELDASKNDVLQQAQVRLVDWIVKLMVSDIQKIVSFLTTYNSTLFRRLLTPTLFRQGCCTQQEQARWLRSFVQSLKCRANV
jgi:hypothetical protein